MGWFKLPDYKMFTLSKRAVQLRLGSYEKAIELLDIDKKMWSSFGEVIPSPYSVRIVLSDYGKKPVVPLFVPIEDALIIFKKPEFLIQHFRMDRKILTHSDFLPEDESYFMIRHFSKFMSVYTEEEVMNYFN